MPIIIFFIPLNFTKAVPIAKVEVGCQAESVKGKAFILTAFHKKSQITTLKSQRRALLLPSFHKTAWVW
jgi:hypothetical protein